MKINDFFTKGRLKFFLIAILMIGIGSLATLLFNGNGSFFNPATVYAQDTRTAKTDGSLNINLSSNERQKIMHAMQDTYRDVAQKALPVVVEINVVEVIKQKIPQGNFSPWEFFEREWPFQGPSPFTYPDKNKPDSSKEPQEREFRKQGLGSGVVVRQNGTKFYVVTNNHVIGNSTEIGIRLNDGRQFEAKVVGKDARTDLALVTFESKERIPVISLGDSDNMMVGDMVFAVGNPLGFESSITSGIVSALGRRAEAGANIANFTDYIQTDAAINPGNSGGALVNLDGELIGINTWIASRSGGSEGLGFAIPINNVKKAISDFIDKGKIVYGWLGVSISDVVDSRFSEIVEELKLKDQSGALVLNLFKGSPAEKSGILPGDLIVKMDSTLIKDANQLTRMVGSVLPGDTKQVTVIRYGEEKNLAVRFETRQEEDKIQSDNNLWPGLFVQRLTTDIKKRLTVPDKITGVVISGAIKGTPAEMAGFREGDIITKINNAKIENLINFYQELNRAGKEEITFRIYRSGSDRSGSERSGSERSGSEILLGLVK
jgi:serine protease Do